MNFFKFYNPNPNQRYHKDGTPMKWLGTDCTIRSLCCATGMDWKEAYRYLFEIGMELCMTYDDIKVLENAYKRLGFVRHSFARGEIKPTVNDFRRTHKKGTFLINLSGHMTCVKNGKIYDTWSCGGYKVRSYHEVSK